MMSPGDPCLCKGTGGKIRSATPTVNPPTWTVAGEPECLFLLCGVNPGPALLIGTAAGRRLLEKTTLSVTYGGDLQAEDTLVFSNQSHTIETSAFFPLPA